MNVLFIVKNVKIQANVCLVSMVILLIKVTTVSLVRLIVKDVDIWIVYCVLIVRQDIIWIKCCNVKNVTLLLDALSVLAMM